MAGRDWLSRTLRDLRADAGLSGVKAAKLAGISQPRISRIEVGRFLPTEDEIRTLCRIYSAPAETRRQLLQAVRDLGAEAAPARVVLQRGAWKLQRRIAAVESGAAVIEGFQPAIIPGLAQTEAYARAVFGDGLPDDQRDRAVAARMARAAVLRSDREITLILAEGALRWQAGGPGVMIEQLEHLVTLPVGIIPWTQPVDVFPLHGFSLYDRRTAIVGTRTATAFITDPRDVQEYAELVDALRELATFDTGPILERIVAEYRALV
jgi:transcriptional regulator with XRE-family HTH domain